MNTNQSHMKKRVSDMLTDKWLSAIGKATQTTFWAIGYFFGFTLTTALSFGLLLPGSFPEIGKDRRYSWHLIKIQDGKAYLLAEAVSMIGWLFLSILSWLVVLIWFA